MPKRSYKGDKRRREIAKKKKREEKLSRKHAGKAATGSDAEDTSYLEYLHPGGLPEELREPDTDADSDAESVDEETSD
jgi:hypothetical protein